MNTLVLAIDGPSGSGKSSTAKALAIRANWSYLDTGALYRAATYLALQADALTEEELYKSISQAEISFNCSPKDPKVFLDGADISDEIRYQRINDHVSAISAMPSIRQYLLDMQRKYISEAPVGIVVEGRDIGTVVAPTAPLKIYLYADLAERANRRESESSEELNSNQIAQSLQSRDQFDSTRKISPLAKAEDAAEIDSTRLSFTEVVDQIWRWMQQRNLLGLPTIAVIGRHNVGK